MKNAKNKSKSMLDYTLNTRDLGGYAAKDGKTTAYGRFIRSDLPKQLSEEDEKTLREKKIDTIIDFRDTPETAKMKCAFADREGFVYYNFPIYLGSTIPHSPEDVPRCYFSLTTDEVGKDIFQAMAEAKGGVLYHCTAGKDRTGAISAILLMHSGVQDEEIIKDYMLTKYNSTRLFDEMKAKDPNVNLDIVIPREAFIVEFMRLFREKYKTTDQYFRAIGLSEEEIQKLKFI